MKKRNILVPAALLLIAGFYLGAKHSGPSSSYRDEYAMRAKNFVRRVNRRDYEACYISFDDMMRDSMTPAKIKNTFEPIMETLGQFKRFRSVGVSKRESYFYTVVKCEYANGLATFTILFDEAGFIGGVYVK